METQLGVTVLLTPKFHAELAGEGVEYSWAHSKAYYRRMPLSRKRGRDNFKQLVKDCTCPVSVLTKKRIEKFASRARAYICTYHHLYQEQQKQAAAQHEDSNSVSNADSPLSHKKQELVISYSDIERVSKAFKGHRCVLTLTMVLSIRSSGMQGSKMNDDFMDTICEKIAELFGGILL